MASYTLGNIQASGFADAAYRFAVEAQGLENELKFSEAKEAHSQAAKMYREAKQEYAHLGGDAEEVRKSLSVLEKTHIRQEQICG